MKDVGIDLTRISRFNEASEALINRILSPKEIEVFKKESDNFKTTFLAGRFAAKEAYFKATGDKSDFNTLSFLNDKAGKPYMDGHPEIAVSFSDQDDYVVVIVMVKE